MSLNDIIASLQIHGIGCEKTNFGYTIGFVIPSDINVAVKSNKDFDRYDVKYKIMQSILKNLAFAGATIKKVSISPKVTIYGVIPAYGAWACYQIYFKRSNGDNIYSQLRKIKNLIPTRF